MSTAPITRVGIVAKSGLTAAAEQLEQLGVWLTERGIEPIYERETAALTPYAATRRHASRDELPSIVGLPRPQGRIPAPLVQFLELIRSDTYMALGAAIAASLVLLLVTTALLKAC